MRYKLLNTSNKLKVKIFISLALCISISMIVASVILYSNFVKVASNQIYLANMKNLEQVSTEVSIMSNVSVTLANQLYQDVSVANLQYNRPPEIYDLSIALRQLVNYRLSIPFIESIYVYNLNTDTVYTEAEAAGTHQSNIEGFTDTQAMDIIRDYKNFKPYIPIPRKYVYSDGTENFYYTFLSCDVLAQDYLHSAIMVNISEDWIHSVINNETEAGGSETLVIDKNGILVSNSKKRPMLEDFSNKSYIKNILSNEQAQGSFIDVVDGVKSLVLYTKPDTFGWRYVRILNWETLFNDVENIRTVTIIVGLSIFILGVLISLFISGRLYLPIGKMLLNIESLEVEKRSNNKTLKHEFLRNLVLGRDISCQDDLKEEFNKYSLSYNKDSNICILLLKIDHYKDFIQQFNIEDRNLYKFAIGNIACEILADVSKAEAVDMGNDSILIILEVADIDVSGFESSLSEQLNKIQKATNEFLKISVSITVSTIVKSVDNIHQQYNEVIEAALHRLFYGHGCIISSQTIMQYKLKEYTYPMNKEKLLIDSIMAGKINETRKIYNEIVEDTYMQYITVYNLTISHLIFTLNNTVNTIKNNNSNFEKLDFSLPAIMLNEAETVDEIDNNFYSLFDGIEKCLEEKKNSKHDTIIQRINESINQQYFNSSLSVDSLADSIGMSTPYICRIYKQYTLHTILDEIVKVRMEKARELLLETNIAIDEIAEKTGFSNSSYFYRAFKTVNGITPNEYRCQKNK